MLHEVKFRCGHTAMMELTGQVEERTKKAERYSKHIICPDCRANAAIADGYNPFRQQIIFPIGFFSTRFP